MMLRTMRTGPFRSILSYSPPCSSSPRQFSHSPTNRNSIKPNISSIAEIRKLLPGTTMIKAKEALIQSKNDLQSAIAWLEKDSAISGAAKASKVGDRQAKEGGIGINIIVDGGPPPQQQSTSESSSKESLVTITAKAGIVELNCETDFVGRNEIFQNLLKDIAHTVALFPTFAMGESKPSDSSKILTQEMIDIPTAALLEFPLMSAKLVQQQSGSKPRTVGDAILDVISRLGERIHLARASALNNATIPAASAPRRSDEEIDTPWLIASAFTHGGVDQQQQQQATGSASPSKVMFSSTGKVASLLLTRFDQPKLLDRRDDASLKAMRAMARSLARQSAGMPTRRIRGEFDDELSLYSQAFIMKLNASNLEGKQSQDGEESVAEALEHWGRTWMGGKSQSEQPVSVLALRRWELGEENQVNLD